MEATNEQLIRQIIENWAIAVRAKDIPGILAHHSEDILLFDVPDPIVQSKGIEAYRESWEHTFYSWYGNHGQFEVTELDITASEDVAFATGIINCAGTADGKKVSIKVRLTMGLKKINSQWIIVHEHHSEAAK
jgi:ketosteroid isomerase-like protein